MEEKLSYRNTVRLFAGEKCFGPGVAELLRRVRELHSLRAAAMSMNMAYSKAWTVLRTAQEGLGVKLLRSSTGGRNGGGATLTAEGERLLAFCNNAGPGFLLGVCGAGVFSSSRAGAALYLIHVAAALCAGLLICRALPPVPHGTYPHKSAKAQRFSTAFPAAVQNALTGCFNVSAFVVFFTVLARLLLHFLPQAFASSLPCALLLGFLELTSGVLSLPCSRAGFLSCAALLGWGGLSVHCQTLSVLAATPLSARYYLKGKALQALLSLLLALPALPVLFP